ncbi:TetR/AcrR family transcriptional regulator [Loktanella sp. Alg231-35]|uniref:TetR/AcrR family transcriptional regulator n=1 Tax=Loktanella sp. Alg231-35 TaxID=1922220 RepID=UPI00131EEFFF|nr:TetR/AcrR family transcriptional regulator [Loktanella sp. Alg231-35]
MAGRPTNRDERYLQVMQALVRCVARFGLEGATLTQIAKEAGLTRPLIRHHLGNREEMIGYLTEFVISRFSEQNTTMISALPKQERSTALVQMLFSESAVSAPDMVLAFASLTARATDDADLRAKCRTSLLSFEDAIAKILRDDHPSVDDIRIDATAHGIAALYFNVTSLAPLAMPENRKSLASLVAHNLLEDLKD